jgi:proliferating cell nuclear antigen
MIVTKNVYLFKKSLEQIANLIQETNIRFKDSGIYIKAIDKTQILLVDFYYPSSIFDKYDIDPNLFGINISEFYNMVSRSFDKDKLKLDLKDNYLDINLVGVIDRKFKLSYLDTSNTEIKIPNITYESKVILSAYFLKEILKDVSLISNTVIFKIQDGKFIIESEGDKGKIETIVSKAKVKSKKNIFSKFSLAYLKNITKSIDNSTNIIFKLSEEAPLYIEYDIEDKVKIKLFLSGMLI